MLALAWAASLLRFYTRLFILKRVFWEDFVIAFGLASLTVFAAMVPVQTHYGGGYHLTNLPPSADLLKWGRAFFIAEIMYLLTLWSAKLSIGVLLLRLKLNRLYYFTILAMVMVTTALTVGFIFWLTFQCHPVGYQWDKTLQGKCVGKNAIVNSVYILSALNTATDLVFTIIPIFVIKDLNIEKRSKIWAGLTLVVGSGYVLRPYASRKPHVQI